MVDLLTRMYPMFPRRFCLALALVLWAVPSTVLIAGPDASGIDPATLWGSICSYSDDGAPRRTAWHLPPNTQVPDCTPLPTSFQTLPSVGAGGNTSVSFTIGYNHNTQQLCFIAAGYSQAPVLRVGVGDTLSVQIANTLNDTGRLHDHNCPIQDFGGEGLCYPKPVFEERPGVDANFYPLMANEGHRADGTTNLHVHGLFVSPQPCSDEVLASTIYPANWGAGTGTLAPCQSGPDELSYTYQLPANQPAGAYWYHTHRHGQAEHETQMGLVGAIVVEDAGDAWRQSIGVTDQVLLVTDVPNPACLVGPNCDAKLPPKRSGQTRRQDIWGKAVASPSPSAAPPQPSAGEILPFSRVDQVHQAGECAYQATGPAGGVELWTLLLNGAEVPEGQDGAFPPDSELLTTSMQPGQRQIYRLVNASANSFVAPELVLSENGVDTILPLEVFARDGVGLADAKGNRRFGYYNVAQSQLIVPPAGRVEFVVHAPPLGAKLYVQSSQVFPGCGGNLYPARRLLLVTSAGSPVNPGDPHDADLLENTPSLAPYLSTLGTVATVHRTFTLAEYGRGFTYSVTKWPRQVPGSGDYDPTQTDFYITEIASDDGEVDPNKVAMKPFVMNNATPEVVVHLHGQQSVTEEWTIENSTLEIHAFHMHQIHFQDITTIDGSPDQTPLLDTITVPAAPLIGDVATGQPGAPGYVKLRMTFTTADIGEFVYHCHILEHEDNGMMGKVRVVAD
jgi:FtsP/CotA-like multicopper oxidase with cupredoxin domain